MNNIQAEQRFTSDRPCPICGGHSRLSRNSGTRCYGFASEDGEHAYCTREEFAGQLAKNLRSDSYRHWLGGVCDCGISHDPLSLPATSAKRKPKGRSDSTPPRGSTVYEYHWGDGTPVVRVVRTRDKNFFQQHLNDSGIWVNGTAVTKPPLYKLPELLNANPSKTVLLVEGEKDADRAIQEGLIATTNTRGAKGFMPHMVSWLAGRKVLIISDNDDAGREGAAVRAELLKEHTSSLKVIECLPGLEDVRGGDLSDWFDSGRSSSDLRDLAESLPEWSAAPAATGLMLTELNEFLDQPDNEIAWTVDGWMPAGGTSVVIAKPKVGKSTFARNLSLCVARGADFLGRRTQQGPVIYIALEETKRRVREQFRKIGATGDEPIHIYVGPTPEELFVDIYSLTAEIEPRLIVLDPLFRAVRVHDSSAYAEVTNALDPIIRLAANTGCHVLVPHHAGKQSRDAVDSALGSTAIAGTFDSIFVLRDKAGQRTIEMVLREGETIPPAVLSMERESERISLGPTARQDGRGEIAESILDVSNTGWLTEPEIFEQVTGSTQRVREVLRQLYAEGELLRKGEGKKGSPYLYSTNSLSRSLTNAETTEQEYFELDATDRGGGQTESQEREISRLEDVFDFEWDTGKETYLRTERLQR